MMVKTKKVNDVLWDDNPIDVSAEANFIWGIANMLRGVYMPDKYADVIIPMVLIRRFECVLAATKADVVEEYEFDKTTPESQLQFLSGHEFYNTSRYDLTQLVNEPDYIKENMLEYIESFSGNIIQILEQLEIASHIEKMNKEGCLYSVVKAFSELDLSVESVDSVKMGYIFEHLIGKFYQNVDAGQFYTGRDIIKLLVALLLAEGCDTLLAPKKMVKVADQACGTGGMLSVAYNYIKHYEPDAIVELYGQEYNPVSHAIGLAEMLIKGQKTEHFRNADSLKTDCFPDTKMTFMIENPPFGIPWRKAKAGQEEAVIAEHEKGANGRWGAGLPAGGDAQLLFMQSAIHKLDENEGRGAIITNGSPLFSGDTSSGDSQIRRWIVENDYLDAIIALPTDLFYNTGIQTYVWLINMNKPTHREGKLQLINAAEYAHKLSKSLGSKRNEVSPENRKAIVELYTDFDENENCKIMSNEDFLYKEYTIMTPLRRTYALSEANYDAIIENDSLKTLKTIKDDVLFDLEQGVNDEVYTNLTDFTTYLSDVLVNHKLTKTQLDKIINVLATNSEDGEVVTDKNGEIVYDTSSKDIEKIPYTINIYEYMEKEVLPFKPDAKYFFEENLSAKKPIYKIGCEFPVTRLFYKYEKPERSDVIAQRILQTEETLMTSLKMLFGSERD